MSDDVAVEGGERCGGAEEHQVDGREAHCGCRLQRESLSARPGHLFILSRLSWLRPSMEIVKRGASAADVELQIHVRRGGGHYFEIGQLHHRQYDYECGGF